MITVTLFGLFHCAINLMFILILLISSLTPRPSSAPCPRAFRLITAPSSSTLLPFPCCPAKVSCCKCHAPILPHKWQSRTDASHPQQYSAHHAHSCLYAPCLLDGGSSYHHLCAQPSPIHPFQVLHNKIPDYSHLQVFRSLCYPNLSATTSDKLSPRSATCVFLSYPSAHKGYRCMDLSTRHVHVSRHVVFDETVFPFAAVQQPHRLFIFCCRI